MCGIAVLVGPRVAAGALDPGIRALDHRGPDDAGAWRGERCAMAHRRLSILDLSRAGRQPMASRDGRYRVVLNGEIYNYLELREVLGRERFETGTDTEVLLAAWARWGPACLERLRGMFAFLLWDDREQRLFGARDRFGVKPLYWARVGDGVAFASEIKALFPLGVSREPDPATWATYLSSGLYDHDEPTFWSGVRSVPPGGTVRWSPAEGLHVGAWYDPARALDRDGPDERPDAEVEAELRALLEESVALRFRSDVPVGLCLSGGLDSSLLLALARRETGEEPIRTFTFETGDPAYDESDLVRAMLQGGPERPTFCRLRMEDVPALADEVQRYQDEPYGGLPTLGMALVHRAAQERGVTVLLDGNGLDEGWAGYDYYARAASVDAAAGPVQGSRTPPTRAECLTPEFAALARADRPRASTGDPLRDLQIRDLTQAKIPRAMRFADRVSMMSGRELREPFLDHRIVELGLRQPAARKVRDGTGKWLVRRLAQGLLPEPQRTAPKRAVQTPQREWLAGPLSEWAGERIETTLSGWGREWLDADAVRRAWREFRAGGADHSFFVWQWVSLGLLEESVRTPVG